jgi:hypothetical protein
VGGLGRMVDLAGQGFTGRKGRLGRTIAVRGKDNVGRNQGVHSRPAELNFEI